MENTKIIMTKCTTTDNQVLVSTYCMVYNHEKYLRECLEGFVTQKTNFKHEVIVHDDASTDNSATIIREYAAKYPEIIKPIYQTENQHSKRIPGGMFNGFIKPHLVGKYVAICEGDDCWIDENKLQMQVNYLEKHNNCSFCFTNAILSDVKEKTEKIMLPYRQREEKLLQQENFNVGEITQFHFIPTASFMYRKSNLEKYPDYYYEYCWGGDRRTAMYSTAVGYAHFINVPTAKYNVNVNNSAMTQFKSTEFRYKIALGFINLNNNINKFTDYKYRDYLDKNSLPFYTRLLRLGYPKNKIDADIYHQAYKKLSFKGKISRVVYLFLGSKLIDKLRKLVKK